MKLTSDQRVKDIFANYPSFVKEQLEHLRKLIVSTAEEIEQLDALEETLKWGEPSYLTKYGSTIRIDWKKKNPDQYAVYFKCTSKLVPTFKTVYPNTFRFENNRAILFELNETIPETELRHCLHLALIYHKVKHLPLLGA